MGAAVFVGMRVCFARCLNKNNKKFNEEKNQFLKFKDAIASHGTVLVPISSTLD